MSHFVGSKGWGGLRVEIKFDFEFEASNWNKGV